MSSSGIAVSTRWPIPPPVRVLVRDVLDRVAGFEPLQRYLEDPGIKKIWVNKPTLVNSQLRGLIDTPRPR